MKLTQKQREGIPAELQHLRGVKLYWGLYRYAKNNDVPISRRVKTDQILDRIIEKHGRYLHHIDTTSLRLGPRVYRTASNISWTDTNRGLSQTNLERAIKEHLRRVNEVSYGQEQLDELKIDSHRGHTSTKTSAIEVEQMRDIPHYRAKLHYIGWKEPQIPDVEDSKICGFQWIASCLGLSQTEVTEITGATPESGITPAQIEQCAKHANISVFIFDGLRNPIIRYHVSHDERVTHNDKNIIAIAICHDQHYYEPGPVERQKLIKIVNKFDDATLTEREDRTVELKHKPVEQHIFDDQYKAFERAVLIAQNIEKAVFKNVPALKTRYVAVSTAAKEKVNALNEELALARTKYKPRAPEMALIRDKIKEAKQNMKDSIKAAKAAIVEATAHNAKLNAEQKESPTHRLYVKTADLKGVYARQLKDRIAYPLTIADQKIVKIDIAKKVTIYANDNLAECKRTAEQLGIPFVNQSIGQLAATLFDSIADNWKSSLFNTSVAELFDHRKFAGCNKTWSHVFANNEQLAAVDIKRQYTAIAKQGDLYTIGFSSELEPYDSATYDAKECAMYYVNTSEDVCFDGTGIYDYKVVEYGLNNGLIAHADISHKLRATKQPDNDLVLGKFINQIYDKISNDKVRKKAINLRIGKFGTQERTARHRTIVTSSAQTMGYYQNIMMTNPDSVYKLRDENDDVVLVEDKPVWAVSSRDKTRVPANDKPVRLAIVQRARMLTHKYAQQVRDAGFKVVKIKTDGIYYVSRDNALYPVSANPTIGELRREHVAVQEIIMYDSGTDEQPHKQFEHLDAQWKVDITANKDVDFDAAELLKHNRAYVDGAAGTGKTYVMNELRRLCEKKGLSVASIAFTHAAANILDEGRTIHNLFGISLDGGISDKRMKDAIKEYDVFIVDECSMIPDAGWKALCMLPADKCVYGAGDFRQLEKIDNSGDTRPACDTSMFKALFGYTQYHLTKQHRADAAFANDCIDFWKTGVLPQGVTRGDENKMPDINICATNEVRRKINNKKIQDANDQPSAPLDRRVYTGYVKDPTKRYGVEEFDRAKLEHIIANRAHYEKLLMDSQSRSPGDCLVVAEKYLTNAQGNLKYVEYSKPGGRGRWQPDLSQSLGTITRQIRHTIAGDLYDDLDIDNCHPVILAQKCKKEGIAAPCLYRVVDDRDSVFGELIADGFDRGFVKKMILAIINGGQADMKKYQAVHNSVWISNFKAEIDKIHELFAAKAGDKEWRQHINKRRQAGKPVSTDKGAYMNHHLLEAESAMLESITQTLRGQNMLGAKGDRFVWCFDGIMVKKSGRDINAVLRLLEKNITRDTGYVVSMSCKPMNNKLPLPDVLDRYECRASMLDTKQWDEFQKIYKDMPVIASATTDLYHNNEYFTITQCASRGVEGVVGCDISDKAKKAVYARAKTCVKELFRRERGVARITKKYRQEFTRQVDAKYAEMVERARESCMTEGAFYKLENDKRSIMISEMTLRRQFRPRYAITVHKAQGSTFKGEVLIHEFERMTRNGRYVAMTRAVGANNVAIVGIGEKAPVAVLSVNQRILGQLFGN